ncbi:MAG: hypothetical protein L0Y39_11465 [Methylococcaceae bacterium]|nr:hypothetical protein [Methylococcaceae bacterium]
MDNDTCCSDTKFREKLENTKRVANQNADMHSTETDRYDFWSLSLNCFVLLFSAFLLSLSLASEDFIQRTIYLTPDMYKWSLAIFAFLNFSITLVVLAWRPDFKAAQHKQALAHFARSRHRIDIALSDSKLLNKEDVELILKEYIDIDHLPKISDNRFNKLKQRHLIKVSVSKELSKNPHRCICEIKRYLKKNG